MSKFITLLLGILLFPMSAYGLTKGGNPFSSDSPSQNNQPRKRGEETAYLKVYEAKKRKPFDLQILLGGGYPQTLSRL